MYSVKKVFPRGASTEERKNNTQSTFEGLQSRHLKKCEKTKTKYEKISSVSQEENNFSLEISSANVITSSTIEEGMLIMGVVSHIESMRFFVSLPGRLQAQVSAINISDSYTKAMESCVNNSIKSADSQNKYMPLTKLFEEGELVYGRVITVKESKYGPSHHIELSIKPSIIHAVWNHIHVQVGFIFNGAIQEIQEHGYIIESGIKLLRCFLPKENVPKHRLSMLFVGQMVHLKVTKTFTDTTASNCTCRLLEPDEMTIKLLKEPKLDYLMPSTLVKFRITKILKNGLQGTIMKNTFPAYVNEHHLVSSLSWLNDYKVNEIYEGHILYVMPLTKLVYITLNKDLIRKKESKENQIDTKENLLKSGDIINEAIVHHMGSGGVILILNEKFKGFLSYQGIKHSYKGNYDHADIIAKYAPNTKHTVRIVQYNIIDRMYICTDNVKLVNETIFSSDDVKPGDFVTAEVIEYRPEIDGFNVKIGRLKGILEKFYLQAQQPSKTSSSALKINTKIKCRVLDINKERRIVYLTNRREYMAKDCEVLLSLDKAKINSNYMGTVVKVNNSEQAGFFALVKFFNNIKGILYKQTVGDNYKNILEGHTMLFSVLEKQANKVIVGLASNYSFEVGKMYEAKVLSRLENGLEIEINTEKLCDLDNDDKKKLGHSVKVMLPIRLLSDFWDLWQAKLQIYNPGQKIKVICLPGNVLSLRDAKYFDKQSMPNWQNLKTGDIIRTSIKDMNDEHIELMAFINGYNKPLKIHPDMLLLNMGTIKNISLQPEQIFYAKVLGKELETKILNISLKFFDVWKGELYETAKYCDSYLKEVDEIRKQFLKQKRPIAEYIIGDKITAYFQCENNITNDWEYSVENSSIVGIVKKTFKSLNNGVKLPEMGTPTSCLVLWIDYNENILYLSNNPTDQTYVVATRIQPLLPESLIGKCGVTSKILYHGEHVFVCSIKKQISPLICCPTRLLFNDIEKIGSTLVKEETYCKLSFIYDDSPIAVLDSIAKMYQNKKRKLTENVTKVKNDEKLEQIKDRDCTIPDKKIKLKIEDEIEEHKGKLSYEPIISPRDKEPVLKLVKHKKREPGPRLRPMPGVDNFWNNSDNEKDQNCTVDENNCNTTIEDQQQVTVKRKLNAVEKFKLRREEEAQLRTIEENNSNPNQIPTSVNEFERLVISEPNNSRHWINYMVFYSQKSDFEKARIVAQRATKTISLHNSQDRLNIWIALLNLEVNFGTDETFENTFKEAVTVNDSLKVHLRTVEVLKAAGKHQQLIEVVNLMIKKFKTEPDAWKVAANTYFSIGEVDKAQPLLKKSLNSLPEREHVNMIVSFALLNNQYGNSEMAQTLMDEVVTSYPKRVDVWAQYVDMLVKSNLIDSARNVLQRASVQQLPLKKMRIIFNKYIEFEERFGTLDSVESIKQLAKNYIKKTK